MCVLQKCKTAFSKDMSGQLDSKVGRYEEERLCDASVARCRDFYAGPAIFKSKLNVPRGTSLVSLSVISRPYMKRAEEELPVGTDKVVDKVVQTFVKLQYYGLFSKAIACHVPQF